MNYQPSSHDGSHITNFSDFFEWWYFDLDLDDDYHIYIVWHSPLFNLKDFYGTLIVRINGPDNELVDNNILFQKTQWMNVYRYHRSLIFQSENECDISFPSGYIKEVAGNYIINIDERDLHIDLRLEKLFPPISIEDNLIYQTKNREEYFKWFIPLPRATAKGIIEIESKRIEVEGISYHDHNWGNLNLRKSLHSWVWGRIFFSNATVIFGDIHTNDPNEKVQFLLLVDQNGHCIDTKSLRFDYRQFDNQNKYKIGIPKMFSIEFQASEKYRIYFEKKRILVIEDAPLGSFDNNILNVWLTKCFYFFKLYHAPNLFKKWYGRLIYSQSEIFGKLFKNDQFYDGQLGTIEVMSFAD